MFTPHYLKQQLFVVGGMAGRSARQASCCAEYMDFGRGQPQERDNSGSLDDDNLDAPAASFTQPNMH